MDGGYLVLVGFHGASSKKLHRRLARHTLQRVSQRAKRFYDESSVIGRMAAEARVAKLHASVFIPDAVSEHRDNNRLLRINDRLCLAVECKSLAGDYGRVQFARTSIAFADFALIWFHPEECEEAIFVVPASRIRTALFGSSRPRKYAPLAFRADKPQGYGTRKPRLDVWEHHNAWHLLSEERNT